MVGGGRPDILLAAARDDGGGQPHDRRRREDLFGMHLDGSDRMDHNLFSRTSRPNLNFFIKNSTTS